MSRRPHFYGTVDEINAGEVLILVTANRRETDPNTKSSPEQFHVSIKPTDIHGDFKVGSIIYLYLDSEDVTKGMVVDISSGNNSSIKLGG